MSNNMNNRLKSLQQMVELITKYNHSLQELKVRRSSKNKLNFQLTKKMINIKQNQSWFYCQDFEYSYDQIYEQKEIEPESIGEFKIIDNERILFDKQDEKEQNRIIVTKIKEKTMIQYYRKQKNQYYLENQIEVQDFHGKILENAMIGSALQFNKKCNKVIYVAEDKKNNEKGILEIQEYDDMMKRKEYEGDLGEKLEEILHTSIFIYDLQKNELLKVMIQENLFFMNVQLVDVDDNNNNDAVLFIGYSLDNPVQIGILHCLNRITNLYLIKPQQLILQNQHKNNQQALPLFQPSYSQLTILSDQQTNWKPIIDKSHSKLAYLTGPLQIPHCNYYQIDIIDLQHYFNTNQIIRKTLVKQYLKPDTQLKFAGFAGFFDLVDKIQFSNDDKHLLFTTYYNISQRVYSVDLETGQIVQESFEINNEGQMDEWLLLNSTSINQKSELIMQYSTFNSLKDKIFMKEQGQSKLAEIKLDEYEDQELNKLEEKLKRIKQINMCSDKPNEISQAVLLYDPCESSPQALVVIAHGGPHANVINTRLSIKLLLLRGFSVLLINFTGSLGYSQDNITQLLSHIGHKDAIIFHHFIQLSIQSSLIDPQNIAILGGSYGGYLATRLPQLLPNTFKCSVILNPVTDIIFNKTITDIPEWNYAESLNIHNTNQPISLEHLNKMYQDSPVYHQVPNIPQLILLGKKDRRVPYQQGLYYYNLAKYSNVDAQCYVYNQSDHSLSDSIDTTYDVLLKSILFLEKHLLPQ